MNGLRFMITSLVTIIAMNICAMDKRTKDEFAWTDDCFVFPGRSEFDQTRFLLFTHEAVHHNAAIGDVNSLKENIEKYFLPVNSRDRHGETPLHYAALNQQKIAFIYLLSKGGILRVTNRRGKSVLDVAQTVFLRDVLLMVYKKVNANNVDEQS